MLSMYTHMLSIALNWFESTRSSSSSLLAPILMALFFPLPNPGLLFNLRLPEGRAVATLELS
jgi:hypothetical protein